jgi:CHAT domain-containing protein
MLRAAERHDEHGFRDAVEALYDLLIRPIDDLLPPSGTFRIVPDRRLDDVPFAALVDRETGVFFAERFASGIAPTAAAIVARCPAATHAPATARALVVGNPAFDRARHAGLAPLPDAEWEARRVAALYPGATVLLGADATAPRLLAGLAGAQVVHVAAHALVNDRYPLLSSLLMAPDPAGASGDLVTALDLKRAAPAGARLVVLGACRAAGGGTERPGGAFSLARPFLAAGVPEVVGTLWQVSDRPASALLVALHEEYRRGRDAVESLRQAQLAALRGNDPETRSPLAWGAFVVDGTPIPSGIATREAS